MNPKPTPVELIKKHWFWGALLVALGVITAGWWLGTAAIAKTTADRTGDIESSFGALKGEMDKPYHPNDTFEEGMTKIGRGQSAHVWKAWNDLYNYQLEKVLIWPAGLPQGVREKFESGKFFALPASSPESVTIRNIYRNYVLLDEPKRLRARLKVLEPEPLPEPPSATAANPMNPVKPGAKPGAARPPMPMAAPQPQMIEIQYKGLVKWENFDSIFNNYPWLQSNQSPSPLAIQFCQEDIWAYTGLIDTITAANEGVTDWKKARVKEIFAMEIGQWVAPAQSTIVASLLAATAAPGAMGSAGGEMGSGGVPMMDASGATAIEPDKLLRYNRYVKPDGTPLGPDETNPDPEFNLIPFRLVLLVDQRQITKLLSVCANSTLPIRVKQIQMYEASLGSTKASAGLGARGGGSVSTKPKFRPGVGGAAPLPLPTTQQLATPFDVAVELRGVIYIYQRPIIERLPEVMRKIDGAENEDDGTSAVAPAPAGPTTPAPVETIGPVGTGQTAAPVATGDPADADPATGSVAPVVPVPAEAAPADGAPAAPAAPAPEGAAPAEGAPAAPAAPATETPAEPAAAAPAP